MESASSIAVGGHVFWEGVKYVVKETAYSAARVLWIVTACLVLTSSDTPLYKRECAEHLGNCFDNYPQWTLPNSGSVWGESMCTSCYNYCIGQQGVWDCPRPK